MPTVIHTTEERREALAQRQLEIEKGDDPEDVFGYRPPSTGELTVLATVDSAFRETLWECRCGKGEGCGYVCGAKPDRDWQIIWRLASGKSQRKVAAEFGIKQPTLAYIKERSIHLIWKAIKPLVTKRRARPAGIGDPAGPSEDNFVTSHYYTFVPIGRETTPGLFKK